MKHVEDNFDSSKYDNLLSFRDSSIEDIFNYYGFDQTDNYEKLYRIFEEMARDYRTLVFREPSKLLRIISYASHFFDIYFILYNICDFLHIEFKKLLSCINYYSYEQFELINESFTKTELELSEQEKYEILKDVFSFFKVELKYSFTTYEITDDIVSSVFRAKSKDSVLKFARYNADLIRTFKPILKDIMEFNILRR